MLCPLCTHRLGDDTSQHAERAQAPEPRVDVADDRHDQLHDEPADVAPQEGSRTHHGVDGRSPEKAGTCTHSLVTSHYRIVVVTLCGSLFLYL